MERSTGEIVEIWKNFNFLWFPVLDDSKTSKLFEEKFGIPMAMHRVSRVEKFEDRIKLFSAVKQKFVQSSIGLNPNLTFVNIVTLILLGAEVYY